MVHVEAQAGATAGWPRSTRSLVGLPVRIGDVEVGRIADVLFNRSLGHVFGLAVDGRRAHRHFLPWVAVVVAEDHVETRSVHALLATTALVFYIDNGVGLTSELERSLLDDVLVDANGDVSSVVDDRRADAPSRRAALRVVR